MRGNELLDKMELINPDYIEAANAEPKREKSIWVKWVAMAACLCLIFSLAVPTVEASVPAFYDMLYAVSPTVAQFFRPVQLSCKDNGIRMEVVAVYIHEDMAEIYVSMQDLEETRIDETIDLFDSYQINTPFDCTGNCKLSSYNADTHTATFLITIEQWNGQNIIGDKLTFSIREFLSNKKTYKGIIDDVKLKNIELTSETQTVQPRGIDENSTFFDEDTGYSTEKGLTVLKTGGSISSPINGVTLTGIGYVDGHLHVQIYYADILKTDNHGSIALLNNENGEMITCTDSISFFDDEKKGCYEEYIFTEGSAATFGDYELYGEFVTSPGAVEGNWSVTFPLENDIDE